MTIPPTRRADHIVGVDHDFEFLRRVDLFSRLSLDEQKYVQTLCDKVSCATGESLITQGRPGSALYVVIRGQVDVCSDSPDGKRTVLVELGPGACSPPLPRAAALGATLSRPAKCSHFRMPGGVPRLRNGPRPGRADHGLGRGAARG